MAFWTVADRAYSYHLCFQLKLASQKWGPKGLICQGAELSHAVLSVLHWHRKQRDLVALNPPQKCLESARSSVSWTENKRQAENNLRIMSSFFVSSKAPAWLIKNAPKTAQCQPFLLAILIFLFERFVLYPAAPQSEISLQLYCYSCDL